MIPFQDAVQSANPITAARSNVTAIELLRTLADGFPTIARMLGEDAFFEVAAQFVAQQAPTALASIFYGDRFPAFLQRAGASSSAEYVADIAAIDAARIAARRTADASAVPYAHCERPFDDFSAHLVLHPSINLLQSRFPAVTGWRVNQPRGNRRVRRWGPEDALITCTRLEAEVWHLPEGGFAFLAAVLAGASLADAAAAGFHASASFDLAEMKAVLTASAVVTNVKAGKRSQLRHRAVERPRTEPHRLQVSIA